MSGKTDIGPIWCLPQRSSECGFVCLEEGQSFAVKVGAAQVRHDLFFSKLKATLKPASG